MTTPAQRHYLRTLAAQESARVAERGQAMKNANGYELMLVKLDTDRRRLKMIQSVEKKIEAKRAMLPEYSSWIDGVLDAGSGVQDDVLTSIMIWRIDTGDIAGALPLVSYALRHKLTLPDQYQRTLPCLAAEEIAETAQKALAAGTPVDPSVLISAREMLDGEDMPDEVRAKLIKTIGAHLAESDPLNALEHYREALRLHDKCGVKKDIEKLERILKKAAADS